MNESSRKKVYVSYKTRDYLRVKRKQMQLTAMDVSLITGITDTYYAQLERGERGKRLPVGVLIEIAHALGFSLSEIIKLEDNYIKEAYMTNG